MSTEQGAVVITGGGRGLGRAFALALADLGFPVCVTARTEAEIAATADAIVRAGGRAIAVSGDVTDPQAVARVVAATEVELGPIDVLINNAGVLNGGLLETAEPDAWWRDIEVNLRGPFLYTHAVLPGMIARTRGRIINIASGAGLQPVETGSAYCVSKAALIRLNEATALETAKHGIATFAVDPGTVRTPMNLRFMASPEMQQRSPDVVAWFQQLFAEGGDTPIEQSVQLVVALATGKADVLSGCFVRVSDDLDALLAHAEAIQREDRLRLRLAI
jgi:NAD(P)-dependent dehydrogenase (short-subunit alcohol dehydrogenase family)